MTLEQQLLEIRQRNAERVKQIIEQMGTKYLCHPANQVKRNKQRKKKC